MFKVDVLARVKALCVLLRVEQDGSSRPLGSGFFFMDQDVVATAKHIIEEVENSCPRAFLMIQPFGTLDLYEPVQCVYHSEQDLAFIHLDRPRRNVPQLYPGTSTEAGFIYVAYDPVLRAPFVKWVPRFQTPEPRERRNSNEYSFEWDGATKPGNSGGALIASDGGVVAILSGVSHEVESVDCEGRPIGSLNSRARAVWIEPLLQIYFGWKFRRDSIPTVEVPFQ